MILHHNCRKNTLIFSVHIWYPSFLFATSSISIRITCFFLSRWFSNLITHTKQAVSISGTTYSFFHLFSKMKYNKSILPSQLDFTYQNLKESRTICLWTRLVIERMSKVTFSHLKNVPLTGLQSSLYVSKADGEPRLKNLVWKEERWVHAFHKDICMKWI